MRRTTLLRMRSPRLEKDLSNIQDLLLQNRVAEASELYSKSQHMNPDALEREIKRERDFVHVLSESKQFGAEESKYRPH